MSIVAGVDFGTLSVRVTLVDTNQGKLGSGVAEYPLHRRKEDPDYATQRHHDHTRVIRERMEEHGVPILQVINTGGIPPKNETLNRVYANVLGKPVLIPQSDVTSLGSAIFAALAGGAFSTIEDAQALLCPKYRVVEPDRKPARVYEELYGIFREMYFGFGKRDAAPIAAGHVLGTLRRISTAARGNP